MKTKKICFNEVCSLGKQVYSTAARHIFSQSRLYSSEEGFVSAYVLDIVKHETDYPFLEMIVAQQPERLVEYNQAVSEFTAKFYESSCYKGSFNVLNKPCILRPTEAKLLNELVNKIHLKRVYFELIPTNYREYLTANWRLGKIFIKDGVYKHMNDRIQKFVLPTQQVDFIVTTYFDLLRYGYKPYE